MSMYVVRKHTREGIKIVLILELIGKRARRTTELRRIRMREWLRRVSPKKHGDKASMM